MMSLSPKTSVNRRDPGDEGAFDGEDDLGPALPWGV